MPIVEMKHTVEAAGLAEVLKLFFGPVIVQDNRLSAGSDNRLLISRVVSVTEGNDRIGAETEPDSGDKQTCHSLVSTSCTGQLEMRACVPMNRVRRELKRQLYCQLELLTGLHFPWGSLTGVRPTQIALEAFRNNGNDSAAAAKILRDYWRVSAQKASLAIETALAEQRLIEKEPADALFVYAGVPFCPGRCDYCSFISRDAGRQKDSLDAYVDAMIEEARQVFDRIRRPVRGLYLGGGTPTSLSDSAFDRLLEGLVRHVPLHEQAEWTIEAGRPDTVTREKLERIRQAGANRICINPQTMHDETLMRIGRGHSVRQSLDAFELARSLGFDHINMDLIAGLPGEHPVDLLDSVDQLLALQPDSITLHTLAIKRSARLQQTADLTSQTNRYPENELTEAVAQAGQLLRANGYLPYYLYRQKDAVGGLENTGFARSGKSCLYNVAMMSDQFDVIGLGSGSISKRIGPDRTRRVPNSKDLLNYQQRLQELIDRKIALFIETQPA